MSVNSMRKNLDALEGWLKQLKREEKNINGKKNKIIIDKK